jgi:hypothetical protein
MKNKPRKIKDLLELVLENINSMTYHMCGLTMNMYEKEIISYYELATVRIYFQDNCPKKQWKLGEIEPRVNWLKEHIKLLSS